MAISQQDYQLKQGETTDQYNTRIAGLRALNGSTDTTTESFSNAVNQKLMSSLDIISSEPTALEKTIQESISGLESAKNTNATGIKAFYEQQRADVLAKGDITATTALEARSGFGTINAILQNVKTDTERQLKDLDLREQQALAIGNAEIASQIANLKVQQLQFQQQAQQQAFTQLLGIGSYVQQQDQLSLQQQQQKAQQAQSAIEFLVQNNVLKDADATTKRGLEDDLGLPTGTLDNIDPTKQLNLQNVSGVGLVNITQDRDGNPKVNVLVRQQDPSVSVAQQASNRITTVNQYLSGKFSEDNYVSPDTYIEAKNKYIQLGGTIGDFLDNYPFDLYLSEESKNYIPESWRNYGTTDTGYSGWVQ